MGLRDKIFNTESKYYSAFTEVINTIIFGICWMVCCIPILTIGPATSAMYKMFFDMRRDRKVGFNLFFKAFGQSFKNSFLIGLIQILTGLPIAFTIYLTYILTTTMGISTLLYIPSVVIGFIWLITFAYAYAYTAYFEQKIGLTIRNSFIMSMGHLKNTLAIVGLTLILPAIYLIFTQLFYILLPILILALIPMIHWWKSYFYMDVFKVYDTDEKEGD